MIDVFCRVVTIIVLCVIFFCLVGYAFKCIQEFKCAKQDKQRVKQDKQLVKDFILGSLLFRQKDGITKYQLEQGVAEIKVDYKIIFGCLNYSVEILRQLAIDGMIVAEHSPTAKFIPLEKFPTNNYDYNVVWATERDEKMKKDASFWAPNCLIHLTPKGRSFVSTYQTKQVA